MKNINEMFKKKTSAYDLKQYPITPVMLLECSNNFKETSIISLDPPIYHTKKREKIHED